MVSFSSRVGWVYAGLVTLSTAVVLALGGWLLDGQMTRGVEWLHAREAEEIEELLGPAAALSPGDVQSRIGRDAEADATLYFIQLHARDGQVVFRSRNLGDLVLPDLGARRPHLTMELPRLGPVHMSEFSLGAWQLRIASPMASQRRLIATYARVGGVLVLGTAVVSLGLGWVFSQLALRPLRAIERTAQRIGGDNLGERIPVPRGRDELARLAVLLNQTFDRLEGSFAQVRRFTADASHELKTPLTLLRLNTERLRQRLAAEPATAVRAADADELLEEIDRLRQIIDALLFLSKAEAGGLRVALQPVPLRTVLCDVAQDAQVLAEDGGRRFRLADPIPDGDVKAVPTLLRQLLLNLLGNAVRLMPPGGLVTLAASRVPAPEGDGLRWRIVVEDEGPGLPPEQLERVFDRFVRYVIDGQQEKGGRGHGLGLAIARSIAELHRGSLRAENRPDRPGLRLVLFLPVVP